VRLGHSQRSRRATINVAVFALALWSVPSVAAANMGPIWPYVLALGILGLAVLITAVFGIVMLRRVARISREGQEY
jgi:hypothetical protein